MSVSLLTKSSLSKMPGPIKPKDVQAQKNAAIPEEVFEVINALILREWNGSEALVYQDEAAKQVAKALKITKALVYSRNLLDIEDAYIKAGWDVEYDKPGYNESYEAHFRFRK